jgi:CheY-like chemotaxis protein
MLNKVLFIDDDNVALMLNRILVDKTQFARETFTAVNGEDALLFYDKLSESDNSAYPELVFLDLNMPIMDGWEFLEEFEKNYFEKFDKTKIIVLSSSINPEDLERSKQYSMVMDFISKPVSVETLGELSQMMQK